jgi:hypothetical protein
MRGVVWAIAVVGLIGVGRADEPAPADDVPPAPAPGPKPGRGGFGGGGGPAGGPPGYAATGYFARPVAGQDATLGFVRQSLNTALPLWTDGGDMVAATVRASNTLFQTDAILPDSGRPFPDQLWDVGLGLMCFRKLDNGWTAGAILSVGSASDQPFHGLREMTIGGTAFLRVPAARDGDWWQFSVMYSPNGQLNFPIPGVAYEWNPSDRLKVSVGLPLSLRWTPAEEWRVETSYVPLATVRAKLVWLPRPGWQFYGGFDWDSDGYFLVDRPDRRDRFLYLEKRLGGGVRYDLTDRLTADLSAGYAFDRQFGIGRNPLDFTSDRVTVANGAYLGAKLQLGF